MNLKQKKLLIEKSEELKSWLDPKTITEEDGTIKYDLDADGIAELHKRNNELDQLNILVEQEQVAYKAAQRAQEVIADGKKGVNRIPLGGEGAEAGQGETRERKSLGQIFTESEDYKGHARGSKQSFSTIAEGVNLRTLLETGDGGIAPATVRLPNVDVAVRRLTIADLMPNNITSNVLFEYMQETTDYEPGQDNKADFVAEGAEKPESELSWEAQTGKLAKVAHWIPVTDEQLHDIPTMRTQIDNRLTLMLQLKEEEALLNATGDFDGFLEAIEQEQEGAGLNMPNAIYGGFTKVRATGNAEPTGVVINPNDWKEIRTLQTLDGLYIFGSPAEAGPERIWGKPVIVTAAMTEGTALTGDFAMDAEILREGDITINASNSHADFFIKNKWAILAEERLVLFIYRLLSFCKVTGLTNA